MDSIVANEITPQDTPPLTDPAPREQLDAQALLRKLRAHQAELAKYRQVSRKFRWQLDEMREHFAEFFELLPLGYITLDKMGRTLEVNRAAATILGEKRSGLLGKQFIAWVAKDDRPLFLRHLRQAFASRSSTVMELKIMPANGVLREMQLECKVMETAYEDRSLSCHVLMTDLSEHRELETAATLTSTVIDGTTEGIMITDSYNVIRSVNPAFERISGYPASEAVGCTPALLKSDHHDEHFYRDMWEALNRSGNWQGEVWNRHKNGEIYPVWLNISAVKDHRQQVVHYLATLSDSPSQELLLERLQYLAYNDVLTGLPNRRLFLDRLNTSLSQARRDAHMLAVFFVDLDRFKRINDTLGHKAGDELLVCATEHMKCCLRESDTLARFGGDEFAVILPAIPDADAASNVARKFVETFAKPLNVNGTEMKVGASIGISIFPNDAGDADALLRHADAAMYRVKEAGRNGYLSYSAES